MSEEEPSENDFNKRWKEFLKAHDDLRGLVKSLAAENKALRKEVQIVQENVCDLIQLGETICAMGQELLRSGVSVNVIQSLLGKAVSTFFGPYRESHGG